MSDLLGALPALLSLAVPMAVAWIVITWGPRRGRDAWAALRRLLRCCDADRR